MPIRFLYIFVFLFISRNFIAQDYIDRQWNYANDLFENGNYFDAITEYKRLMFFDEAKTYEFSSLLKIGQSYKAGGKWEDAIKNLSLAEQKSNNIDEKYLAGLEIVRVNILRRTTLRALTLLDEMQANEQFAQHKSDFDYWRGWAFMMADDWEKAANEFNKISPDHPLKKLCLEVVENKYSVTFAKVISYIIPGAGQIYTGNYLSGAMSLGWNILWGYLTINSFVESRAFDGIMTGSLLWLRFYNGNNQNAEKFVINRNIEIANQAYRYLKNNYEGIKP